MQNMKTYPSGMRLVVETMENYESVSFNMFVQTGSTNEDDTNRGISHFIEHMLFKGTKKRSAIDIVKRLDALGTSVNAYTSQTETVYYVKSTKESVTECVDILSDMYFNSIFDEKEMAREKKVITEEISMYNDNPGALADKRANEVFYEGTPMEFDVAGTKTSVRAITKDDVKKYMNAHYLPQNLILSFAGNITFEQAEELAKNYFECNFKTKSQPIFIKTPDLMPLPKPQFVKKYKDNEQAQIVIYYAGLNLHDPRYYAMKLLNAIWGQGMSSRLFQTIREKLGLVYGIYSSTQSTNFGGTLEMYLATTVKNIKVATTALRKAIDTIMKDGINEQELVDAKTQIINTLKLQSENTSFVSLTNAKEVFWFNEVKNKEEAIQKLENITKEEVNELIRDVFGRDNYVISMVGKDLKTNLLSYFKLAK